MSKLRNISSPTLRSSAYLSGLTKFKFESALPWSSGCLKTGPHYTPSQPPFKSSHGHFCYLFHQGYLIKRQVRGNVAPDESQLFPRRMTGFFITTHRKRRNRAKPRPKKPSFRQISLHKFGDALFGTFDRIEQIL